MDSIAQPTDTFRCDRCQQSLPFRELSRNEETWGSVLCRSCAPLFLRERRKAIAAIEKATGQKPDPFAYWSPAWRGVLADYLQELQDRSGSKWTVPSYRRVLVAFFDDGREPPAMTRSDVLAFLHAPLTSAYKHGHEPSPGTMRLHLSVLNSFYTYTASYVIAGPDGLVPILSSTPPTLGMRLPRGGTHHAPFQESELARFFAAVNTEPHPVRRARDRALFILLWTSARRRAEVCDLRYGDLEQCVFFSETGASRAGWRFAYAGKGHARERQYCELVPEAKDAIWHYLAVSGRETSIQPEDALFIATALEHGGGQKVDPLRPLTGEQVRHQLKRYCRIGGLDERKFCIHSMRCSSALLRMIAGSSLREVQKALAHKSIATTAVYLEAIQGDADTSYSKLQARFGYILR